MPGRLRKILLATAVAALLAGCGSDDEGTIPQSASQNLIAQLDAVEASVAAGDCETAQARAGDLVRLVNELPSEVGVETKDALRDAATNLAELTTTDCTAGTTGVETPTTTDETTEPATTETTTTTTDTTTEEEEEPADDEQPPPDEEQPPEDEPPVPPSDQGPGGGEGGEGGGSPSGGLGPGGDGGDG